MDLRQELQNLNLGTQEFDSWLGNKFEEHAECENEFYNDRFEHDIPLQRSISLDRGIDIFNHLQAIGSDYTDSVGSRWTIDSYGRDSLPPDRYKSLEDIPTSPNKMRSRRASFGVQTVSERNLALAVLNESYKGLDASSGSLSPQIRKLQRCFTFSGSFDSIKESRGSVESLRVKQVKPKLKLVMPDMTDSNSCPVSPEIKRLRNFSYRNSADDGNSMSNDEDQGLEVQEPFYRSISVEWTQGEENQRKFGLPKAKRGRFEEGLRKVVLVKQEFKSVESLSAHRSALELAETKPKCVRHSNLERLKNISRRCNTESNTVPTIIISADTTSGVANISNTSNYVEISRNCDCRICTREKGCFVRNALSKLFVTLLSCREYSRMYWDENNNLKANEMYKCIMQILKLMLGLWLRHLDHKVG